MFRTSLKNIPSRIDFFDFFLYLSFVFIASVLLGFGESGLLFLSGKHSPTVVHTTHYRLWTFFSFIYHNTTWLDPGRVFGCIYNWQGLDTGGLFYLALFLPLSLVLKKKTYTQQCTTLGPSPRQKLLYGIFADILGTFFSLLFPFFSFVRFRETSWKIPPIKDDRYRSLTARTDTLCFFPWLCFPIYDDIILMTTFSTTR